MIGDGMGSGSPGGVGSGGGSGSGPGIGGSGEGGSGVSVGMRAICPGFRSGKHLGHTRERVAVSFTSAVSGEPVEPAAWDSGDQDATRVLEKEPGWAPSRPPPSQARLPIRLLYLD